MALGCTTKYKANLVSSHPPEVAACAAILPAVIPVLSVIVKRALFFEVQESLQKNTETFFV